MCIANHWDHTWVGSIVYNIFVTCSGHQRQSQSTASPSQRMTQRTMTLSQGEDKDTTFVNLCTDGHAPCLLSFRNADFFSCRKRTGGPSEEELEKKTEEKNKDRTFSNPDREGGTQVKN